MGISKDIETRKQGNYLKALGWKIIIEIAESKVTVKRPNGSVAFRLDLFSQASFDSLELAYLREREKELLGSKIIADDATNDALIAELESENQRLRISRDSASARADLLQKLRNETRDMVLLLLVCQDLAIADKNTEATLILLTELLNQGMLPLPCYDCGCKGNHYDESGEALCSACKGTGSRDDVSYEYDDSMTIYEYIAHTKGKMTNE